MREIWKDVKGFPNYQVSNLGNVRVIKYKSLKAFPNENGYLRVCTYKRGKGCQQYVHRLVARAFIGPEPKGLRVSHINENSIDNRSDNLCYESMKDNCNRPIHKIKILKSRKQVGKSGFKGVFLKYESKNGKKKWASVIVLSGVKMYLDSKSTAKEAARAYDETMIALRGKDAVTNKSLGLL